MRHIKAASAAFFIALAALLLPAAGACAQGVMEIRGPTINGHLLMALGLGGQAMDAGGPTTTNGQPQNNFLSGTLPTGLGIVNSGLGYCQWTRYASEAYGEGCWGFDGSGNFLIQVDQVGGATPPGFFVVLNGVKYPFPGAGNGNALMPTSPAIPANNIVASNGGTALLDSTIRTTTNFGGSGYTGMLGPALAGLPGSLNVGRYTGAGAADQYDFGCTRNANYVGGAPGNGPTGVNSCFGVLETVSAGTTAYEWPVNVILYNYGTAADASQNIAMAANAYKYSTGATWAFLVQYNDGVGAPTVQSQVAEFDVKLTGLDPNQQRGILELNADTNGGAAAIDHGIRLVAHPSTFINTGFQLGSTISQGTYGTGLDLHQALAFTNGAIWLPGNGKLLWETTANIATMWNTTSNCVETSSASGIFLSSCSAGTLTVPSQFILGPNSFSSSGTIGWISASGTTGAAISLGVGATEEFRLYSNNGNNTNRLSGFSATFPTVFDTNNIERMRIWADGNVQVGVPATAEQPVTFYDQGTFAIVQATPASNAACTAGQIVGDTSRLYICAGTGNWLRSAVLTGGY